MAVQVALTVVRRELVTPYVAITRAGKANYSTGQAGGSLMFRHPATFLRIVFPAPCAGSPASLLDMCHWSGGSRWSIQATVKGDCREHRSFGNSSGLSLEQLVALNDEMSALVRAGVPLDRGLVDVSEEMPGRIGKLAAQIGQRLRRGESLPQILASDEQVFPPVWRAVVEAGLRSGRLTAALEGLSTTARRVAELRRAVLVAWIYPLTVMALAYGLFVFVVTTLSPVMLYAMEDLTGRSNPILAAIVRLGESAAWWALPVPALVIVVIAVNWYRSGRAMWLQSSTRYHSQPRLSVLRWPTWGRALREGRLATFAELLAMLLDHEVPLDSAVVLAADASGEPGLQRGAREIRDRISSGEVFTARDQIPGSFPPLIGWLLVAGSQRGELSGSLRSTAEMYRRRAAQAATWSANYLPIVLTALVGGVVVLLLALTIFGPITHLLYELR